MFLSKNYQLIVVPRKFGVLNTNFCPRSKASEGLYTNFENFKFPRGIYLNSRMFPSRNYRLIVFLWKFDVLKTNICPRSKASKANMLVLRTSNLQGATIRSTVLTLFCLSSAPQVKINIELFSTFLVEAVKATQS